MSMLTILFITLIVVMVYIRLKIGELVNVVEKRMDEVKELVTHPGRIAASVGEAVIDTALNQVEKMTHSGKSRKRK